MNWLLWKDYRHNRLIVFAGLFLLLAPHVVALYAMCRQAAIWSTVYGWTAMFATSSFYSLLISQVVIALIGGNAIAGERADRSSEFLGSLPIPRKKLLASKLLLASAIAAVIWMNAPVFLCLIKVSIVNPPNQRDLDFTVYLANTAITGLAMFCVAWCLSVFTSSPAYAACGGLVAPVLVCSGCFFISYLFGLHAIIEIGPWYCGICLTLATVCFAVGTWHYLRRVEP